MVVDIMVINTNVMDVIMVVDTPPEDVVATLVEPT